MPLLPHCFQVPVALILFPEVPSTLMLKLRFTVSGWSKHTCTHECNVVPLAWGLLTLAPITYVDIFLFSPHKMDFLIGTVSSGIAKPRHTRARAQATFACAREFSFHTLTFRTLRSTVYVPYLCPTNYSILATPLTVSPSLCQLENPFCISKAMWQ